METQELKCASCGETFDPKDSPYEGSLHLKKCEKCFHLGMQRDAKIGIWSAIVTGVFLTWVFKGNVENLLPYVIVCISLVLHDQCHYRRNYGMRTAE